jgi:uncharacterized membrane protein YccC
MTMDRNIDITMTADQFQQVAGSISATLNGIGQRTEASMKRVEARLQSVEQKLNRTAQGAQKVGGALGKMNENSAETQRRLQRISSASAGVMLGMSALQGNLQGVGFGLIFLQFSTLKYAAAAAALTVVIGGAGGLVAAFGKMQTAGG